MGKTHPSFWAHQIFLKKKIRGVFQPNCLIRAFILPLTKIRKTTKLHTPKLNIKSVSIIMVEMLNGDIDILVIPCLCRHFGFHIKTNVPVWQCWLYFTRMLPMVWGGSLWFWGQNSRSNFALYLYIDAAIKLHYFCLTMTMFYTWPEEYTSNTKMKSGLHMGCLLKQWAAHWTGLLFM